MVVLVDLGAHRWRPRADVEADGEHLEASLLEQRGERLVREAVVVGRRRVEVVRPRHEVQRQPAALCDASVLDLRVQARSRRKILVVAIDGHH